MLREQDQRLDESNLPIVKLQARSHKGKNRIHEHGSHWFVLREAQGHLLGHPDLRGACLLIKPCVDTHEKNVRWVQAINDSDFIVEETDK
jgi:hypothetical protein